MTSPRAFLVHGVRVSVEGDAAAPAVALLAGFPPAGAGPADLSLAMSAVAAPVERAPGGRPIFFHGRVRAAERAGAIVLRDGASELTVSADGGRLEGRVHVKSLADGGHAFAHVALLLAFVVALRHRGLFHVHGAALVAPGGLRSSYRAAPGRGRRRSP